MGEMRNAIVTCRLLQTMVIIFNIHGSAYKYRHHNNIIDTRHECTRDVQHIRF